MQLSPEARRRLPVRVQRSFGLNPCARRGDFGHLAAYGPRAVRAKGHVSGQGPSRREGQAARLTDIGDLAREPVDASLAPNPGRAFSLS